MPHTRDAMLRQPTTELAILRAITKCESCGARMHNMCSALQAQDLQRLSAIAVSFNVTSGRTIVRQGESADFFYNVTKGTVKLFKLLPDGRTQITGFAGVGDFLGLSVSASYAFNAEALDGVTYCRYSRQSLKALLAAFPAMERRLLAVVSNELMAAQEQMLLLGRKNALERLASFLIARMAVTSLGQKATVTVVSLPMTRRDIADYLGMTIETVSRTLGRMKADGLITIQGISQITIRKPAALLELAECLG